MSPPLALALERGWINGMSGCLTKICTDLSCGPPPFLSSRCRSVYHVVNDPGRDDLDRHPLILHKHMEVGWGGPAHGQRKKARLLPDA